MLSLSITCLGQQSLEFDHISDRDGLSQNTVRCIIQDRTGFMWFGTINGLNRYNGREFAVIRSQPDGSETINDNRIRLMAEDHDGYLWMRTMGNTVQCYDPKKERFVDYNIGGDKHFINRNIASNGDVWLWGRYGGACRVIHQADGLQSIYYGQNEIGSRRVNFVHEDFIHRIIIGTDRSVFVVDKDQPIKVLDEGFVFIHEYGENLYLINEEHIIVFNPSTREVVSEIPYMREPPTLNMTSMPDSGIILIATRTQMLALDCKNNNFISAEQLFNGETVNNATFITDNKGNTYVYNLTGVLWRYTNGRRFLKYNLIPPHILANIDAERYEVYHDSRDILWITTYGNGLFALNLNYGDASLQHYTMDNSALPSNHLLCVTEDRSGEIWVGTEFAGTSRISVSDYPVDILYPSDNEGYNRNNAVRLIYEDSQGRFWLGTRGGSLHVYDSQLRKIKEHRIDGGLPFCMLEDHSGRLWLGTRGKGILLFPPSGDKPERVYNLNENQQYTGSNSVFDILIDRKNRLWAATFGGGLHYAQLDDAQPVFNQIVMRTNSQDQTRVILQDHEGIIWTGTNEGVIAFDPDSLINDPTCYVNFRYEADNDSSLNNNEVKAVFEDSRGWLWFGTTGGGLNLLMRRQPLARSWFRHFNAYNGLSNEVIQSILEDDNGNIWVSTEGGSGIARFNPETERFENFRLSNSKQGNLFNEAARWKKSSGELIFGSYSGVFIFDPSKIKNNIYAPPVVITGLKINGINVYPGDRNSPLHESISTTREIRLRHDQNSFNLEFAMLNFHSSAFNQYTCFLDGYEREPNPVTRHNAVAYRNLPSGEYTFRVKGSNSFGVWNDSDTELKITVLPPFWKTIWAYIFYILALIIVAYTTFRIIVKINRLHAEVVVEKQLTEYKLRFFTNISHEFRTPLTIINGAIENLSALRDLPAAALRHVGQITKSSARLMRLIDQLLEFRKLQNRKLELQVERTEVVDFFRDICRTFNESAERKGIDLQFESYFRHHEMLIDRGKCDKIAWNLLSNAMKYTPQGGTIKVKVDISEADDRMILSVADSGSGVPKEKQSSLFERFAQLDSTVGGTGVGLHLTAELAVIHKGKVEYCDSKELGGACFKVSLPLADSNYADNNHFNHVEQSVDDNNEELDAASLLLANYRILVIEDETEVRDFIAGQLADHFSVITAKDGTEGLEQASKEQPDLIVCDVMMPGVSGFEVTRRLKGDFLTSHLPIILLTAHSSEEYQLKGFNAGADAYITKPFSTKYLITRIIKLIEQREKLRLKFAQEPGAPKHLITFTDSDKEFLEKIDLLIEKNIDNANFTIVEFVRTVGIGRTNFFKKVKGITGHSPNEYMRIVRLKKAAEMLAEGNLNVSEIAYRVGFDDPFYFSKCFKAQFGKAPTKYLNTT